VAHAQDPPQPARFSSRGPLLGPRRRPDRGPRKFEQGEGGIGLSSRTVPRVAGSAWNTAAPGIWYTMAGQARGQLAVEPRGRSIKRPASRQADPFTIQKFDARHVLEGHRLLSCHGRGSTTDAGPEKKRHAAGSLPVAGDGPTIIVWCLHPGKSALPHGTAANPRAPRRRADPHGGGAGVPPAGTVLRACPPRRSGVQVLSDG